MKKYLSTLLTIAVLALLLQYPVRTLMAGVLFAMVPRMLDDKNTEVLDGLDLSDETLPVYRSAMRLIGQASRLDPGNSSYPKSLADLHSRIGSWTEVIEQIEGRNPEGAISENNDQIQASVLMAEAVGLEPSNPDYHLALHTYNLAHGHANNLSRIVSGNLEKAVQLFPMNSPLRYSVAQQYLLSGDKKRSLEHAKILAANDDSYRLPDTAGSDTLMKHKSAAYYSYLGQSYLAKALEIAWRASDHDMYTVKTMTPDDEEARDVLDLFMERKGIDVQTAVQ